MFQACETLSASSSKDNLCLLMSQMQLGPRKTCEVELAGTKGPAVAQ